MDDNAKNASSYHLDQEILDARGITMTVEEVAGLPTTKYSERVQSLRLSDGDLAFLKGLRRRIKNRLASQNSRRRSMEHLRRLTRELRAVRACRDDALAERKALVAQRGALRDRCQRLRQVVVETLRERLDTSEVPQIDVELPESQAKSKDKSESSPLSPCDIERELNVFECRIDKLVQQSVNHIFKTEKKKVFAKTVFISDDKNKEDTKSHSPDTKFNNVKFDSADTKFSANIKVESADTKFSANNFDPDTKFSVFTVESPDSKFVANIKVENPDTKFHSANVKFLNTDVKSVMFEGGIIKEEGGEVLNLSVKGGRRKSHGRKQSAPRRITYVECEVSTDDVLDLKVKKEPQ